MSENERYNIEINGSGQIAGGVYNHIEINGAGNGNGPIDCVGLECNGVFNHNGSLKAEYVEINGTAHFTGSLDLQRIEVNGTCHISNSLNAKSFEVNGTLHVEGTVDAENAEINGFVNVKGDFNADNFDVQGSFDIAGLLNAENISIKVFRKCSVKEIGCTNIEVKGVRIPIISSLVKSLTPCLSVVTIEGDDIHLENTQAKIVRGRNIEIGPNCEIDLIEYTENLVINPNSIVKNQEKIA